MWLQAFQSFRFLKPVDNIEEAVQDMANQRGDNGVVIVNGETREMPEWIRDNWMFEKAIDEGLLVEIVMPKSRKKKLLASAPKPPTPIEEPAEEEPAEISEIPTESSTGTDAPHAE